MSTGAAQAQADKILDLNEDMLENGDESEGTETAQIATQTIHNSRSQGARRLRGSRTAVVPTP